MPAKAEPLLLAAEVNAYSTSDSPCGPELSIEARAVEFAMAMAVPTSTSVGVVRKYSDANFISRAPIFLPRYSGVRPTMSPATKTVTTERMRMPYRPEPVPPGATSPSIMFRIGTPPPSGVYESWKESTAPVEVSVVAPANVADCGTPKRTSVPSVAEPTACGTVPPCVTCNALSVMMLPSAMITLAATMAHPCRLLPTIRPNVRGRLNEITSSSKTSIQLVQVVGFSNGWAEFAL